MQDYKRIINKTSDIQGELLEAQFLVIIDASISHMGANYGPPDPPPQMETTYYTETILFNTDAQLLGWIEEQNNKVHFKKKFKIYRIKPVTVHAKVEIQIA